MSHFGQLQRNFLAVLGVAGLVMATPFAGSAAADLKDVVAGPQRTAEHTARDAFRKPLEVLTFLGIKENSRVIEIQPGSAGYWTEILAPYLKAKGRYIAGGPVPNASKAGTQKAIADYAAKLAASPAHYSAVEVIEFAADRAELAAPASVDFVVTFRNLHNWLAAGRAEQAIAQFYKVLKPGGIFGITDHRGRVDQPQDPQAKSGYVRQDFAIALIEKAGFKLVATSEAGANPKDTKDHPAGVWTLPPTYRLKDQDKAKYAAIGESDRFVLKFVKP